METCIYLFDKNSSLTYKKREHVISAGIGGKLKLPKGYVSDQANELFSKYELMCLRYSPLQIERAKYGPGKRGSLNVKDIDAPDVFSLEPLMENPNKNYVCPLGFLFQNQAYILPQIIVVFDDDQKDFNITYLRSTYQTSGNIDNAKFHLLLQEFLMSSNKHYKKIIVPYDTNRSFVCIGFYKKSWYIGSTNPNFVIDYCGTKILEKEPLKAFPTDYFGCISIKPIFRYTRKIDLENLVPIFIHAKNCFNSLALFKGNKFVQQKIFDRFRQCILTNDGWKSVTLPSNNVPSNIAFWLAKIIHNHEHVVAIFTENEDIMALSVLYGKSRGLFKLGIGFTGDSFSCAVICDFENGKEIWYNSGIPFLE